MQRLDRLVGNSLERLPFETTLENARVLVASAIDARLSHSFGKIPQAMKYATTGGKGLRGFLVMESARLNHILPEYAVHAAAGIECIHAYSLVHDDLPCMDDDNLRRGQPTVHKRWDEATAVLTGDALQALAFEFISNTDCSLQAKVDLLQTLAQAAGVSGMVGGQDADIDAETSMPSLSLDEIIALQAGKTGALITWSATAGARMAQQDTSALATYGDQLGLAFQIWDDVLDIEGDSKLVGKAVQKDANAGKATFVSLLGLSEAKRRANDLVDSACDALQCYGNEAETLREAARFVISRDR